MLVWNMGLVTLAAAVVMAIHAITYESTASAFFTVVYIGFAVLFIVTGRALESTDEGGGEGDV